MASGSDPDRPPLAARAAAAARHADWQLAPTAAVARQRELAELIDTATPLPRDWRLLAAVDVSFDVGADRVFAAVVVWSRDERRVVERQGVVTPAPFPYIPGLLSFREIPPLLQAFARLESTPDLALVDGQGIAHPRRLGIATHLGLCLDLPTVGCAKSLLCGSYEEPSVAKGDRAPLVHRGEVIGYALRTRTGIKPVYVSPGHRATLDDAVALVLETCSRYKLPDPQREAHLYANELRRGMAPSRSAEEASSLFGAP